MEYPPEQTEELKKYCDELAIAQEGGCDYFLLRGLRLPEGCVPRSCTALLRPGPGDGYNARLFFHERVSTKFTRNWNTEIFLLNQKWFAFSWQLSTQGLTPAQILSRLLEAFTRA